jgi:hypothetical protein
MFLSSVSFLAFHLLYFPIVIQVQDETGPLLTGAVWVGGGWMGPDFSKVQGHFLGNHYAYSRTSRTDDGRKKSIEAHMEIILPIRNKANEIVPIVYRVEEDEFSDVERGIRSTGPISSPIRLPFWALFSGVKTWSNSQQVTRYRPKLYFYLYDTGSRTVIERNVFRMTVVAPARVRQYIELRMLAIARERDDSLPTSVLDCFHWR